MGNMIEMTLEQAEEIVERNDAVEWDGWNLVFYTPSNSSIYNKDGVFKDGKWLVKNTIAVNEKGTYVVSNHHARLFTKTRNRSK